MVQPKLPDHLDETTIAAIKVVDQRLADHTLSPQEHEALKEKRRQLIEGVSTSLNERMHKLEQRMDDLERVFKKPTPPVAKKPATKPAAKEADLKDLFE